MAIVKNILTKQYAVCIFIHGTRNFDSVIAEYIEPIKQFVAENYTLEQIDAALVAGRISEQEYQNTIEYKSKIDL